MLSPRKTPIAAMGSSGQSWSVTGSVEAYGTSSAPVAVITSATSGSLAYVTRWPRATSSRMISRLGRIWLMAGMPTIAIWATAHHSFRVCGVLRF